MLSRSWELCWPMAVVDWLERAQQRVMKSKRFNLVIPAGALNTRILRAHGPCLCTQYPPSLPTNRRTSTSIRTEDGQRQQTVQWPQTAFPDP